MNPENEYPRLSKAPIVLAILEIKFTSPDEVSNDSLASLKERFSDEYPGYSTVNTAQLEFRPELVKTPISIKSTNLTSHNFISASKKHEFNLSVDTFTFKQHGEYTEWSEFKKLALSAWGKCAAFIQPGKITRMSIRYVNSIDIPASSDAVLPQQQIFKTFIAYTGQNYNKPISHYFLRYTHPPDDNMITVHFAQELKAGTGDSLPFIVDIDVLYTREENSDANIEAKFDELRIIKNQYFFNNLMPHTLDLIK